MSDNPQQEPAPSAHTPADQEANPLQPTLSVQESFGPPFPEASTASVYDPPSDASQAQSVHDSSLPSSSPAFYENSAPTSPPMPYGGPPVFYGYGYGYSVPPQGPYGPPPNDFRVPQATPLPLGEALRQLPRQYWRVLRNPKAATFVEEQGKAAWNIIWVQLLILSVAEALALLLLVALEFFLLQLLLSSGPNSTPLPTLSQIFPIAALAVVVFCFIVVPLSFFISTGIPHLIAKAFGGRGSFLSYCYGYSLVSVPIGIATLVLSFIPCIGSVAALAAPVYSIILLIYMTMGIHRLSGGKASATVLIPIVTGILLFVGTYVVYFIWIFSTIPTAAPR